MENKLFIPYELALWAKEKGFNEGCFGKYFFKKRRFQMNTLGDPKNYNDGGYGHDVMSAPMYQQILDWLDKKEILVEYELDLSNGLFEYYGEIYLIIDYNKSKHYTSGPQISKQKALDKAIENAYKLIQ